MFIKLLFWLFKKRFLQLAFHEQPKKKGLEKWEQCFIDSNGMKYYRCPNDFDLPVDRMKELQKKLLRLKSGLSDDNISLFLQAMKKALNGGRNPDIARIGFMVTEMELREEILLHPELMFEIVALTYVREDEDPAVIDKSIQAAKIVQFEKDSKEGLYDFFYRAGFSTYMPYFSKLEEDWTEYLALSTAKIKAMQTHLSDYIGVPS